MPDPAPLRIALAQLDFLVGDVRGNVARVVDTAREAAAQGAGLVVYLRNLQLLRTKPASGAG